MFPAGLFVAGTGWYKEKEKSQKVARKSVWKHKKVARKSVKTL